jgi:apolipoprotein D and lipocalin family protein
MSNMRKLSRPRHDPCKDLCNAHSGAGLHPAFRPNRGLRLAALGFVATLLLGAAAQTAHARTDAASGPLQTVASVDWGRYMGTWHEVAKYPNWFQRQCVADTSATYSLQADGTVQVRNRCRRDDGRMDEALGVARRVGGESSPKAQVRFAPDWLSWLPVVWGTYWVVALDQDYQWVVVSEPGREYLWVLARTPTLAPPVMAQVETVLRQNGFDLARLERSASSGR